MTLTSLLAQLGEPITDVEEETFVLFSQNIPSQNLGFVDAKATTLDVAVGNKTFAIEQSPTVLTSNRAGGTTGAVLWKITPLVANWLSSPTNPLITNGILTPSSAVLELGTGISGLIGLAVAPLVARYVLTDQSYVAKLIETNVSANVAEAFGGSNSGPGGGGRSAKGNRRRKDAGLDDSKPKPSERLIFRSLDWETDMPTAASLLPPTEASSQSSFDVVFACDCIYNEALIAPLVDTCAAACALRSHEDEESGQSTICVVAQQLRSPDIFEAWLRSFERKFQVWRVPDEVLDQGLREGTGFVVHVGVLKQE